MLQITPLIFGCCPFRIIEIFLNSILFDINTFSNLLRSFITEGTSVNSSLFETA